MRRPLLLSCSLALALGACDGGEAVNPIGPTSRSSPAVTLGVATTDLPSDLKDEALLALEQDAFRRESRFLLDAASRAASPATRLDQAEIDQGLWSTDELFQIGAQLFQLTFTPEDGYGGKDLAPLARFHKGRRGGPDARKCASCHWKGGPAGAGDAADNAYLDGDGDAQSSALAKAPAARRGGMGGDPRRRDVRRAPVPARSSHLVCQEKGTSVDVALSSKGVSFGVLGISLADGSVDSSNVEGIDPDLVVRPFGWKGSFASLRDAAEDALLIHHGMESDYCGHGGAERVGPFGVSTPTGTGSPRDFLEGQSLGAHALPRDAGDAPGDPAGSA